MSCAPTPPGNNGGSEETCVDIIAAAAFPEMDFGNASSRAMGDEPTPDDLLNNLHVNLFVFDPAGIMLQFIEPKDISVLSIDPDSKNVIFKVRNVYSSSLPRRLHFVVTSAPDLHQIDGGEYISAMASETTTMPALVISDGSDAYWGVMNVDKISDDMALSVKLIRNFVKLSVQCSGSDKFKMLGYAVVNRPSKGTIAPYIYADHLFASFLNPDNTLLDYDEIISQGYRGVNPAGTDDSMTCTTEAEVAAAIAESQARLRAGAADTPYYIYERAQSTITSAGSDVKVTYIIIKGEYLGKEYYYKIDIGRDKDGKFGFYDLLRNFQYLVDIKEVGGAGAPTLIDAMNGAAHNNLSASVVTRDLFSIGYKGDMIEVSTTNVIFTEQSADYELRFRYSLGEDSQETFDPAKLRIYDISNEEVEYTMEGVTTSAYKEIQLNGEVISKAEIRKEADGWYVMRVSSKEIPADSRRFEQNIRFYYTAGTAGLGRTVQFILRRPWNLSDISATTPGTELNDPLNLTFNLPAGMSKSLFPLILTFESDKQNIYAKGGSPLTVSVGKSQFPGATTDKIIYYEWRIEWEDYARDTDGDGSIDVEGGTLTAPFLMNTFAEEDRLYPTTGIDRAVAALADPAGFAARNANNGTVNSSIRIANKGRKYLEPVIVNITR